VGNPVAKLRRGERGNGKQVGRGAGVSGDGPAHVEKVGELALEVGVEASGGKPEVKRSINRVADFLGAKDLARGRDDAFAGDEGARSMALPGVLGDQLENLQAQLFGCHGRTSGADCGFDCRINE
jgi:hypothetical protein